ncbi:MAG: alpha/beta hydrolase [Planctomycetota bacterium]|nr:alpha/beta hydrolase [Planctomycetota bacterium]
MANTGIPNNRRAARPLAAALASALAAMILAAGCGGTQLMPTPNLYALTPDNPFPDVPACFRTNTADIVYATDREPEGTNPATQPKYGYRRSRSLAFGMTTVIIGKDVPWDALVAASRTADRPMSLVMTTAETHELGRLPPTPSKSVERDGRLVDAPEIADARLAAEARFKAHMAERLALTPRKEVYVFIHGTGSNFEEPTYVLAGLWHFMGRCGVPVVYTWPAGGGGDMARTYAYDRESSEFTVYHLKQFLKMLAACPGVEKVHILAHSRGTDTIMAALRELNIEIRAGGGDTRKALKLGCLVLAAADIDAEVSSQRIAAERLMRVPEQMVLYVSATDLRLNMADLLFTSKDRLGQMDTGAMTNAQREALLRLPDIQYIDARIAGSWNWSHAYFYHHPAVSSDLILVLRDNRRPGAEFGRPMAGEAPSWRIDKDYPATAPGPPK